MAQDYPLFGYVYNHDGYYGEPIQINSAGALEKFLDIVVRLAIAERREVMITDADDYGVFHTQNGVILWPREEQLRA